MNRIHIDGMQMCYEEWGQGEPTVVLVHGIPTGPALWRRVAPRLQGVRAIAWEMVGYGRSIAEGRTRDISVGAQADHLRAFLHAMGIRRAVLVGHDLGGGVVQIAAVREPSLCAGLLLANAVAYDSWPVPVVRMVGVLGPMLAHLPKALLERVFVAAVRPGHDDRRIAHESARLHWAAYEEADGAAGLVRQARSLDARDTIAVQHALRTLRDKPVRIVWGSADPFQKLRYGQRLARDLDAPLQVLEGASHFTPEDHPEALARAILELCAEVRSHEAQVAAVGN